MGSGNIHHLGRFKARLETEQAATPLAERIDNQRADEQTNGDTDGNLDHGRGNVEDDRVERLAVLKLHAASAVDLLGRVGRMKYVRPGYRALNKVDRQLALDTFEKHKDFYHPICRGMVEKDLGL